MAAPSSLGEAAKEAAIVRVTSQTRVSFTVFIDVDLGMHVTADVDHGYTTVLGPVAWRAPETFITTEKGQIASPESDVYMLGGCLLELYTRCSRTPFDWLPDDDVAVFRRHPSTRAVTTLQVRDNNVDSAACSYHIT